MALFAIRAKLALVNVGVAVGTFRSRIRKYRAGMTLHARDLGVHAKQWIFCLAVIELRNTTDRLPGGERVAVVTREVQRAVRTSRPLIALLLALGNMPRDHRQKRKHPCDSDRHRSRTVLQN